MKVVVMGSLVLSILHSILLYGQRPGISVFFFCIVCLFFIFYLLDKKGKLKNKNALWLCVPILFLSITYGIWNNEILRVLNAFVMLGLTGYMILRLEQKDVTFVKTVSKIFSIFIGGIEYLGNALGAIKTVFIAEPNTKVGGKGKKIFKAICITIPIVLFVLALLISADSIFAGMFSNIILQLQNIFTEEVLFSLFFRIVVLLLLFIYLVTIFYNVLGEKTSYTEIDKKEYVPKWKLDSFTYHLIVTILNGIYLVFCGIQIVFLFTRMGSTGGISYADYARQGYFQLVIVSLINLMLIVLPKSMGVKEKKYTTVMKLLLVVFTVIILLSSFYRMYLYEQEYGLTFLRVAVFFAIATELLLMIPTTLYIMHKKVALFPSYVAIILVMYVLFNGINVDRMIAKTNIDLFFEKGEQTEDIDLSYLLYHTSIDSVKETERLLTSRNTEVREKVKDYFVQVEKELQEENSIWEWNYNQKAVQKSLETIGRNEEI